MARSGLSGSGVRHERLPCLLRFVLPHTLNSLTTLLIPHAASGVLLMALSLPLLWEKVPPNGLYGFRVKVTLENPPIW